MRGKTPPTSGLERPGNPAPTAAPGYDPYADSTAYEAALQARFALPLADDLRAEVDRALAASPWNDTGIDTGAAVFTVKESATIASALNARIQAWPAESRGGPDAALVKSLFLRFSDRAMGSASQ
jgi:hypothetical protein